MNNIAPWDIDLKTRINFLRKAKQHGQRIGILLCTAPDASTFRYRCYNFFRASELSKTWKLHYFSLSEITAVTELLCDDCCDVLVYSRLKPWSYALDELAYLAHQHGILVVNDLDDCVCGQTYLKEMFNNVAPDSIDVDYWINTSAQFELVSQVCDAFLTTNDFLGQILSSTHNHKPYFVIPNSLNQEQIDYSGFIRRRKQHRRTTDNQATSPYFLLGYFSGSATHAADLEVIYPELVHLLLEHDDIKLRVVGKMQFDQIGRKLIRAGKIELYPVVDFLELQRLISEVDINLAPLNDNTFTNCKSELKFFEAAIVDTPTIASPTFAFAHSIQNQTTGYLCRPGEWTPQIEAIYHDRQSVTALVECARRHCLEIYSPSATATHIDKIFTQIHQLSMSSKQPTKKSV